MSKFFKFLGFLILGILGSIFISGLLGFHVFEEFDFLRDNRDWVVGITIAILAIGALIFSPLGDIIVRFINRLK